jgi:hypothetical protein
MIASMSGAMRPMEKTCGVAKREAGIDEHDFCGY